MAKAGATEQLAAFVISAKETSLPPEVLHQARRSLVDWLGVTIGGATEASVEAMVRVVLPMAQGDDAALIGRAERTSVHAAALINGQAAHVLDFDDTLLSPETTLHGCAPIFPAAMALAEARHLGGLELLTAYVLGFEVAARVALAAGKPHYDAGWHVTGTTGHFGSAAASGAIIGLSAAQLTQAFGIAGTQASGLKEVYGSSSKALHAGRAASDGLLAALLAQEGYTGGTTVLEGRFGFLNLFSSDPRPERLVERLGERWLLLEDGFKPYACGSLVHAAIDAAIHIGRTHAPVADDIESVQARVHWHVASTTGKTDLASGLDGKFSAAHCLAVALLDHAVSPAQFTDERVLAQDASALRQRITLDVDETCGRDEATVAVTLRGGQVLEHTTAHASGTPENPVSDETLSSKFLGLVAPRLGMARAERLLSIAWAIDTLGDVAQLTRSAVP
ncbi:MAG: MmgE/PrpD family protein [Chloroflexota bacterium]